VLDEIFSSTQFPNSRRSPRAFGDYVWVYMKYCCLQVTRANMAQNESDKQSVHESTHLLDCYTDTRPVCPRPLSTDLPRALPDTVCQVQLHALLPKLVLTSKSSRLHPIPNSLFIFECTAHVDHGAHIERVELPKHLFLYSNSSIFESARFDRLHCCGETDGSTSGQKIPFLAFSTLRL
jgi:hypothetical protein